MTGGRAPGPVAATPAAAGPAPWRDRGTLYQGGAGMWAWVTQRITGVLVYFFLLVHVLDTSLVRVSPGAYDAVIATYKTPVVGFAEVGLVGAVLYHALNGLRLIAVDASARAVRRQGTLLAAVLVVWVGLMVPFTVRHLLNVLGG